MSLIKKPYGLIYNTDGSLCVTVRDDDIPFQGVKAFAVEEGTENLVTYYDGTNDSETVWTASNGTYSFVSFELSNKDDLNTDNTGNNSHKISLSCEYKIDPGTTGHVYSEFFIKWSDGSHSFGSGLIGSIKDGNWHRISRVTETPIKPGLSITVYSWRFYFYPSGSTGKVYLRHVQAEDKSFVTSFVEGTRSGGQIVINDKLIPNNFVLSFIAKQHKNLYVPQHLIDIIDDLTGNYHNRLAIFTYPSINELKITILNNDIANNYTYNPPISILNNDLYYVFTYNNGILKVYVNGELLGTISKTVPINSLLYFVIGARASDFGNGYQLNGLISNLYIGEYDPDIWTDEFIQELYNAKKPFAVPAKIPII